MLKENVINPELAKKREQMRWFVNKLLFLCDNPISPTEYGYKEVLCFDYKLLEESGIFPLGRFDYCCGFKDSNEEYASYCVEMLNEIKSNIFKLKNMEPNFDFENFTWFNEMSDNGYNISDRPYFYIDIYYKPIFDAYLHFMDDSSIGPRFTNFKKSKILLPEFANDLRWKDITIRFLNNEEVHITLPSGPYHTDYEVMGFRDKKSKKPNLQWNLLKILSSLNGVLSWKNNRSLNTNEAGKIRKRKQLLSKSLKKYFHTVKDDPFFEYRKENSYKIKIMLIPEQGTAIEPDYSNPYISREISDTEDDEKVREEMFDDIKPEKDPCEFTQE